MSRCACWPMALSRRAGQVQRSASRAMSNHAAATLFDVVVVGGGVVGAAFANMLASSPRTRSLKVLVVEAQQFPPAADMLALEEPTSARHVALNSASVDVLTAIGVWDGVLSKRSSHFDTMRVWDSCGDGSVTFDTASLNITGPLGTTAENDVLQSVLFEKLAGAASVDVRCPANMEEFTLPVASAAGGGGGQSSGGGGVGVVGLPPVPPPIAALASHIQKTTSGITGITIPNPLEEHNTHHTTTTAATAAAAAAAVEGGAVGGGSWDGGKMVTFSLSDGTRAQTRLLVAADGARSLTRDKAGIKTIGWPYEQKGIVANVVVDRPNHTAWQRFTPTGPIALLPLHSPAGREGQFLSSVVWSNTPEEASRLCSCSDDDFVSALNEALSAPPPQQQQQQSGGSSDFFTASAGSPLEVISSVLNTVLPPSLRPPTNLTPRQVQDSPPPRYSGPPAGLPVAQSAIGKRASFPLSALHSPEYVRPRFAVIGDAGHAIHPLAGQGLNLGFADVVSLHATIADALDQGQDIGDMIVLEEYQKGRMADNLATLGSMDVLYRTFSTSFGPLAALRNTALSAVDSMPMVKAAFASYAMGKTRF